MAYGKKVLDHYENPRNVGKLDTSDASVGTGMVGAPACGDVMRLQIKVSDDGVIEAMQHRIYPWKGIMWHPERSLLSSSLDVQIIKSLFHDR